MPPGVRGAPELLGQLPSHLWVEVAALLAPEDLARAARSCKLLREAAEQAAQTRCVHVTGRRPNEGWAEFLCFAEAMLEAQAPRVVSAGMTHTLCVGLSDGRLRGCGSDPDGAECVGLGALVTGRPTERRPDGGSSSPAAPYREARLHCARVREVAAGTQHSLALSEGGRVYSFGRNSCGQLGRAAAPSSDEVGLGEVLSLPRCASVGAGSYCSAAVGEDGAAWTWGSCAYGELGLGIDRLGIDRVSVGDGAAVVAAGVPCVVAPRRVAALSGVAQVAMGRTHTLFRTAGGELHACGRNNHGQLGLGRRGSSSVPVLIEADTAASETSGPAGGAWADPAAAGARRFDGAVLAVSAGNNHSLAVTCSGGLYSWGCNEGGQLGFGSGPDRHVPTRVAAARLGGARVVQVAAGLCHSLALAEDGLYTFGDNSAGQLGRAGFSLPQRLPLPLSGGLPVQLAAGAWHSAVASGDHLFTWGRGDGGQLGFRASTGIRSATGRPVVCQPTPVRVPCAALTPLHC